MTGLDTVRICAVALLAVFCFSVVKKINSGFELPLKATAAVVFFGIVLSVSLPLFSYASELIANSELGEWSSLLLGAFGIALLSHLTSEICRDCGEPSIGSYVELVGKAEILLLCLPLIKELLMEVEKLVP